MVDVKKIIQDMARRGMNAEQIIGTLKELGVPDAERVFQEALESLKEVSMAPPGEAGAAAGGAEKAGEEKPAEKAEITIPEEDRKPVPDLEKIMSEAEKGEAPADVKELRQKLDEMESLLKALQDTVKQVLETDRSVLLRMKKE